MRDVKEMSYSWLTDFFIAVAVGLFVLVPFGLVAGRLKRMDMMIAYMVTLFLLMCGLASVGMYVYVSVSGMCYFLYLLFYYYYYYQYYIYRYSMYVI